MVVAVMGAEAAVNILRLDSSMAPIPGVGYSGHMHYVTFQP